MKIIFDFDYTLFDTRKFKLSFQKAFEKLGADKELFFQTYKNSKIEGIYNPQIHFKLIKQAKPDISIRKLEKALNDVLKETSKFLYPDTLSFLEKWQGKVDLFLLSSGQDRFQRKKIENSSIQGFFKEVFTSQEIINKASFLKNISGIGEKTFFIDDRPEALSKIKQSFPKIITVRMSRRGGKYITEPASPQIDFLIKTLKELEKLMSVTR